LAIAGRDRCGKILARWPLACLIVGEYKGNANTCEPAGWQSAWIGLIVHFRLVRIEIPQVRIKANIALLGKFSVIVRQLIDAWLTVWIDIGPPRTERPGRARKLIFCVVRVLRVYTLSPVHACTSSAEYPWLWSPIDGIQCLGTAYFRPPAFERTNALHFPIQLR